MANRPYTKKTRQRKLSKRLKEDPFLTDEELAEVFSVSVQTIRLDRMELGIPEVRERVKKLAEESYSKVKSLGSGEIVGELVDLNLGESGISILEATNEMAFEKSQVIRGYYIFAQANSLAIAVINSEVALTGVANIKYKEPVCPGDKLVAKAVVKRKRGNKYFVWVNTYVKQKEVFRGKFILVSLDEGVAV